MLSMSEALGLILNTKKQQKKYLKIYTNGSIVGNSIKAKLFSFINFVFFGFVKYAEWLSERRAVLERLVWSCPQAALEDAGVIHRRKYSDWDLIKDRGGEAERSSGGRLFRMRPGLHEGWQGGKMRSRLSGRRRYSPLSFLASVTFVWYYASS